MCSPLLLCYRCLKGLWRISQGILLPIPEEGFKCTCARLVSRERVSCRPLVFQPLALGRNQRGIPPVCLGHWGLLLGIQKDQMGTTDFLESGRSQPHLGEMYLFLARSGGRWASSLHSLNTYYCLRVFSLSTSSLVLFLSADLFQST